MKSGRKLRISRDGTPVAGAQTDSVTINNEPIDITDKDDAGWRVLMADVGMRTVSSSVEGILKDAAMISAAMANVNVLIDDGEVEIEGIATFAGNWHLQGVELGAEQAGAVSFTATLESAGPVTVVVAPYNTVLPAVTGTPTVGQTLSGSTGTWAGNATITYARQWQSGPTNNPLDPRWANISGATSGTRVLAVGQSGQYIRQRVTATNSEGSTIAFSNIVGPVAP
jgi:predicted secreted protein